MSEWQRWKNIMKCYPFEESRLAKWSPPFIVQPKYDGDRCKAYPTESGYIMLTSEENPYFSVPHILKSLVISDLKLTLDGEMYSHDLMLEGGHELIHGICSRKTNLHPRHQELMFYVFDLECAGTQMERLIKLESLRKLKIPYVEIAPFWLCDTLDEVKRVYDNVVLMGYEGIIIRNKYNVYEAKRSTMMMKFKPKQRDDYKIVGWREEISKDGLPKGRIGSLVMSSQAGDNFAVSAGLNDEQRNHLWSIRDELKGKTATVHYQHLTNKKIPKGTFNIEIGGIICKD